MEEEDSTTWVLITTGTNTEWVKLSTDLSLWQTLTDLWVTLVTAEEIHMFWSANAKGQQTNRLAGYITNYGHRRLHDFLMPVKLGYTTA